MEIQRTEYVNGAIKEIQRVAVLFGGNFNQRQYVEAAKEPYGLEAIRWRLKVPLNEIKKLAGLSVKVANRWRAPKCNNKGAKRDNTTERRCNMEDCNKLFHAVDHMRSCPACATLKRNGGVCG